MTGSALRRIWLCADDYGISPGVNAAIRDLIARRRINATSVMVVAPSFSHDEASALVDKAATHAAIGLHVTLTAPFRPLSSGFSPLRDGAFPSLAAMAGRALVRALQSELLVAEVVRQVVAFRVAFGRAPDYVDGHHHIHVFPQIREAVLRATKETAPKAWLRQCQHIAPSLRRLADPKGLFLDALSCSFRKLARANGMRTNPAFAGTYVFRQDADFSRLFPAFLDGMPDGGVIMCHPGTVDAELKRLDPVTDLRAREYAYFSDEAFPHLLAAHRVTLGLGE